MDSLAHRLAALPPERLRHIGRGIEKESLRVGPDGALAMTPHPAALGAALTNPRITTDFSESQIELVTGVHRSAEACIEELTQIHIATYRALSALGDERLWVSSMPCRLPADENIPIGVYGTSNVGRSKSIYRMGLGHRYGRRMETICGIHYNWSLPGLGSADYFGVIRNFRRNAFLLLYLFGASPAVCSSFVEDREHTLEPLGQDSFYLPHATSLRMGRLGYQSDAQSTLAVSYNSLESYADSLEEALTRPYPAYEALGIRDLSGGYNQLATTLLQIENEFYGTIRAKRVIRSGERPLHALRERGVEYIEVRLMDLDPFEIVGINATTARVLDLFLLYCALSDSPKDSPAEIAAIRHNQQLTASRGREPGLELERDGATVLLRDWVDEILHALEPVAKAMDQALGGTQYVQALNAVQGIAAHPERLPSARVVAAIRDSHGDSFVDFVRAQSERAHAELLAAPFPDALRERYARLAAESVAAQKHMEESDTLSFEAYRRAYVSVEGLRLRADEVAAAA